MLTDLLCFCHSYYPHTFYSGCAPFIPCNMWANPLEWIAGCILGTRYDVESQSVDEQQEVLWLMLQSQFLRRLSCNFMELSTTSHCRHHQQMKSDVTYVFGTLSLLTWLYVEGDGYLCLCSKMVSGVGCENPPWSFCPLTAGWWPFIPSQSMLWAGLCLKSLPIYYTALYLLSTISFECPPFQIHFGVCKCIYYSTPKIILPQNFFPLTKVLSANNPTMQYTTFYRSIKNKIKIIHKCPKSQFIALLSEDPVFRVYLHRLLVPVELTESVQETVDSRRKVKETVNIQSQGPFLTQDRGCDLPPSTSTCYNVTKVSHLWLCLGQFHQLKKTMRCSWKLKTLETTY